VTGAGRSGDVEKAIHYARRAGDRAVRQLAYEEGARLYQMALEALEGLEAVDEGQRCELTLALGEAYGRAGETDQARAMCRRAAELARATGAADQLARAALGYRTWWGVGLADEVHVGLLAAALRARPPADSVLRDAELAAHARLADELRQPLYRWQKTYFGSTRAALAGRFDEAEALAQEALVIGQQKDIDAEQTYGVQMLRVRQVQGRLGELE